MVKRYFIFLYAEMYEILPYKLSTQNFQKFPPLQRRCFKAFSGLTYFSKWKMRAKLHFHIFPVRMWQKSWHGFCMAISLVFCTWETYYHIFPTFADSVDCGASMVYFPKNFNRKTVYLYRNTPNDAVIFPKAVILSFRRILVSGGCGFAADEHMFAPVFASENVCSHREKLFSSSSLHYIEKKQYMQNFCCWQRTSKAV